MTCQRARYLRRAIPRLATKHAWPERRGILTIHQRGTVEETLAEQARCQAAMPGCDVHIIWRRGH